MTIKIKYCSRSRSGDLDCSFSDIDELVTLLRQDLNLSYLDLPN